MQTKKALWTKPSTAPLLFYGPNHTPPGGGCQRFFRNFCPHRTFLLLFTIASAVQKQLL
jgi:hypothetical protein